MHSRTRNFTDVIGESEGSHARALGRWLGTPEKARCAFSRFVETRILRGPASETGEMERPLVDAASANIDAPLAREELCWFRKSWVTSVRRGTDLESQRFRSSRLP